MRGGIMFNMTREERQVTVFFLLAVLFGAAINYASKINSGLRILPSAHIKELQIDLNKADRKSLESLPGIGEKLAGRIIDYRRQNLKFKHSRELKMIKGITRSRYDSIKDLVTVQE